MSSEIGIISLNKVRTTLHVVGPFPVSVSVFAIPPPFRRIFASFHTPRGGL